MFRQFNELAVAALKFETRRKLAAFAYVPELHLPLLNAEIGGVDLEFRDVSRVVMPAILIYKMPNGCPANANHNGRKIALRGPKCGFLAPEAVYLQSGKWKR